MASCYTHEGMTVLTDIESVLPAVKNLFLFASNINGKVRTVWRWVATGRKSVYLSTNNTKFTNTVK
jgi:hypothetical protein